MSQTKGRSPVYERILVKQTNVGAKMSFEVAGLCKCLPTVRISAGEGSADLPSFYRCRIDLTSRSLVLAFSILHLHKIKFAIILFRMI